MAPDPVGWENIVVEFCSLMCDACWASDENFPMVLSTVMILEHVIWEISFVLFYPIGATSRGGGG